MDEMTDAEHNRREDQAALHLWIAKKGLLLAISSIDERLEERQSSAEIGIGDTIRSLLALWSANRAHHGTAAASWDAEEDARAECRERIRKALRSNEEIE